MSETSTTLRPEEIEALAEYIKQAAITAIHAGGNALKMSMTTEVIIPDISDPDCRFVVREPARRIITINLPA